jgi:hypothetical protein
LHVLKRWAAWPPGIRWLAGIAAVVLGLAVAWTLFVPLADLLARHDVGSATGPLYETALDNARGRLLTLGAGVVAAGALLFTGRSFLLSREGQVTDRYTKAIEQLGSDKLDVRIGGIYALERIARDSRDDHPQVVEVLTAYVREHARWPADSSRGPAGVGRPDVQIEAIHALIAATRAVRSNASPQVLKPCPMTSAWSHRASHPPSRPQNQARRSCRPMCKPP